MNDFRKFFLEKSLTFKCFLCFLYKINDIYNSQEDLCYTKS